MFGQAVNFLKFDIDAEDFTILNRSTPVLKTVGIRGASIRSEVFLLLRLPRAFLSSLIGLHQ